MIHLEEEKEEMILKETHRIGGRGRGKGRIKYKEAWTIQTPNNQHHHLLEKLMICFLFHIKEWIKSVCGKCTYKKKKSKCIDFVRSFAVQWVSFKDTNKFLNILTFKFIIIIIIPSGL